MIQNNNGSTNHVQRKGIPGAASYSQNIQTVYGSQDDVAKNSNLDKVHV
jgi:hypothetical protein